MTAPTAPLHLRVAGDGPVAIFIHGFPLDSRMWIDQLERLGDVRTCVAVDLAGFGQSPPIVDDTYPMDHHAVDLVEAINGFGSRTVDVVGLSMGGYVALALAETAPDVVRSLALVDTKATADTPEGRQGRDEARARLRSETRSDFASRMVDVLVAPDAAVSVRQRMRTMMESTAYETIHAALGGMRDRPDRMPVLAGLDAPVGVIVGEHDEVTPIADAEAMAAQARDATLSVVAGAGHMSPMEAPDAVAAALRTLWGRS